MPVTFRSNAWLPERANKLKPKVFNASSASGGVRNPLPSWTVSPFSATADSKLVNTTSPFKSPWITGTAAGAVSRVSDRIIDCPAKVIVIGAGCGRCAKPSVHTIADRTAKHTAFARIRPAFNLVVICLLPSADYCRHLHPLSAFSNHQRSKQRANILRFFQRPERLQNGIGFLARPAF